MGRAAFLQGYMCSSCQMAREATAGERRLECAGCLVCTQKIEDSTQQPCQVLWQERHIVVNFMEQVCFKLVTFSVRSTLPPQKSTQFSIPRGNTGSQWNQTRLKTNKQTKNTKKTKPKKNTEKQNKNKHRRLISKLNLQFIKYQWQFYLQQQYVPSFIWFGWWANFS